MSVGLFRLGKSFRLRGSTATGSSAYWSAPTRATHSPIYSPIPARTLSYCCTPVGWLLGRSANTSPLSQYHAGKYVDQQLEDRRRRVDLSEPRAGHIFSHDRSLVTGHHSKRGAARRTQRTDILPGNRSRPPPPPPPTPHTL